MMCKYFINTAEMVSLSMWFETGLTVIRKMLKCKKSEFFLTPNNFVVNYDPDTLLIGLTK